MSTIKRPLGHPEIPVVDNDIPVMYEDEGQEDMGDAGPHTLAISIINMGVAAYLASRPELCVFANLNMYYLLDNELAYLSPDVMVVHANRPDMEMITSYRIERDGPAPLLTVEVLSERSHQQRDLEEKPIIYARLGVAEYILVDASGQFLKRRLLLRRLTPEGIWEDEQDEDGGITSVLGFRIILDTDGQPRIVNVLTGRRYLRPKEAEAVADQVEFEREARHQAEERLRQLEAELARLRRPPESQS